MLDLETERLRFRQWRESDFDYLADYFSDEKTAKYVGGVKSREEAWRLLATYIGHWQLKGFSYLPVEEKESQRFVGCTGLWKSDPWPELELGYWILKEMQGQGYASEAGEKVKEFAFQVLQAPTLVSYIDVKNEPSIKVAERLGAVLEKNIQLLEYGLHGVYRYSVKQLEV